MKLKCELILIELDGSYIIYSSDRSVFGGILRTDAVGAGLLESLKNEFKIQDITAYYIGKGFTVDEAEKRTAEAVAVLSEAGLLESEQSKTTTSFTHFELVFPEEDKTDYSTMNTGCYYNSCCDCVEFNGWMSEDNEKPYIAML